MQKTSIPPPGRKNAPATRSANTLPATQLRGEGRLRRPLANLCGEGSEGRQAASVRLSQGLEGIRGTWFNHCQRRHELNPHSALALFGVLPAPRQSAHQAMDSRNPSTPGPHKGIPLFSTSNKRFTARHCPHQPLFPLEQIILPSCSVLQVRSERRAGAAKRARQGIRIGLEGQFSTEKRGDHRGE